MELHVLPERTADAAGNMAVDFLLLQRYAPAEAVRFRHYGWQRPAFTFGYGQKFAEVTARLPAGERLDVTRRPTGGGLVDHREDWTYALVLPRAHPLFERPGPAIYRAVHEALAAALSACGAPVTLQAQPPQARSDTCFERAESGDVVRADDGRKVAGAAMKRGKHALLLQGSIWRPAAREVAGWDAFGDAFVRELGAALALTPGPAGWPEFSPEEEEALIDQYSAVEWIERR